MDDQNPSLIKKAQDGDSDAFRELIDKYSPRIYSIAYQTSGNSEDARDIAQEVFLRLYRKLGTFEHTSRFTTWMYRMTVNLSIDHMRRNPGRRKNVSMDEFEHTLEIPDSGGLPDAYAEHNELKGVISRLAGDLTPKQQKVFVLRDLQDFSTAEIADILKCSVITVRVHLANARRNIKKALTKYYPNLLARNGSGGENLK